MSRRAFRRRRKARAERRAKLVGRADTLIVESAEALAVATDDIFVVQPAGAEYPTAEVVVLFTPTDHPTPDDPREVFAMPIVRAVLERDADQILRERFRAPAGTFGDYVRPGP